MKRLTPVKNTAGEGFYIETYVVAWFTCHLLAGVPLVTAGKVQIESLECQMHLDGWKFDDVVVTATKQQDVLKIGCSIKSFPVFGVEGAPKEFRESIWNEWLSEGSPFRRDHDKLALICSPHNTNIYRTWSGLLESASKISPQTLAKRFEFAKDPSKPRRDAFSSLRCPSDVNVDFHDDRVETAKLLSRLTLFELDFENTGSRDVKMAVILCQQCLEDSNRDLASYLWAEILAISGRYRTKGGVINLPVILKELSGKFPLKHHPSFSNDWAKIEKFSRESISTIPCQIGGKIEVKRSKLYSKIEELTTNNNYIVALGRTGNGKSVLAKSWVLSDGKSVPVWISHEQLNIDAGVRAIWGISETWTRLIERSAKPLRIVIDGIDRCFSKAEFAQLAQILNATYSPVNRSHVKLLITCTSEEWNRVLTQITRHNCSINFGTCNIPQFVDSEISLVQEQFPKLTNLFKRPHLQPMLRWPKILDMLTLHGIENTMVPWTTESEFVQSFWLSAIQKDDPFSSRGEVLQKLVVEASSNRRAIGIGIFTSDERKILKELTTEKYLVLDQNNRTISFNHELFGDYARLRVLETSNHEIVSVVLKHVRNPNWDRAIRLLGLSLMEGDDSNTWLEFFESFDSTDPSGIKIQNLLLEAPIFAVDTVLALEQIWTQLREQKGLLMKRFIRQFLLVASTPDPRYVELFKDNEEKQTQVEVNYRIPHGPYWPSLLSFLVSHKEELIKLIPEELADVCLMWLPLSEFIDYGMEDASRLAVDLASDFVDKGNSYSYKEEISTGQKAFGALMLAASTLPIEVTDLILTLSGRKQAIKEEEAVCSDQNDLRHSIKVRGKAKPWKEGPKTKPVNDFSKVFLSGDNIGLFCKSLPIVAEEVMFALLLDIPREHDSSSSFDIDERGFNNRDSEFSELFWNKGPFITFLRYSPLDAIAAIVRLVNFATDRSKEIDSSCRQVLDIEIEHNTGTKKWEGHEYTALWHRGHVFAPKSVCCALMALEKWFYECRENDKTLFYEAIDIVLERGRSIALLFALISIGKKYPELFLSSLKPIIESYEVLLWDNYALDESRLGGCATPPILSDEKTYKMYWNWFHLEHRKEILFTLIARMSQVDEKWHSVTNELSVLWKKKALTDKELKGRINGLLSRLDYKNYEIEGNSSQGTWKFKPLLIDDSETSSSEEWIDEIVRIPDLMLGILNGNNSCDEEQMEIYWSKLEYYMDLDTSKTETGRFSKWSAILGIAAVAVVHHKQWLRNISEREKKY